MLINKFQHRQEKAKEREEWAWCNDAMEDIGDVHSSNTVGNKGLSCRRQKTVQSAMGLTIITTYPKGFALMTEDPQPRITMDSTINGSRFMIDWGAKPASTIGWGQGQYS
jgi:hypothetical protein